MKVLVTGGAGFIGSHVVDKLIDRGFQVRIYDLAQPYEQEGLEYFHASLLDEEKLRMAMSGVDYVLHIGAIADVKHVFDEPAKAENINTRGTLNVLEAAKWAKVKRVVYTSTVWVYSDTKSESGIVDEDSPISAPSHLYTATKLAGEHYCKAYSVLYDLDFTVVRYGVPYGPRARDGAVLPIFVNKALKGEPLTIAGDGSQFRRFVYVEDLAEGNVLALKESAKNRIYNLEGAEKVSIKDIAETVKKVIGDVKIEYIEGRKGDFSGNEISRERAKTELGWEATTSFEDGVRKYVDWYKEHKNQKVIEV